MFRVIIAGTRTFTDYDLLCRTTDALLANVTDDIEIVSGHACGADMLGEKYAKERGYALKVFPTNWDEEGKAAGYIRNKTMADYADALVAFWDDASCGTMHMINLARERDLKIRICHYKQKTK